MNQSALKCPAQVHSDLTNEPFKHPQFHPQNTKRKETWNRNPNVWSPLPQQSQHFKIERFCAFHSSSHGIRIPYAIIELYQQGLKNGLLASQVTMDFQKALHPNVHSDSRSQPEHWNVGKTKSMFNLYNMDRFLVGAVWWPTLIFAYTCRRVYWFQVRTLIRDSSRVYTIAG